MSSIIRADRWQNSDGVAYNSVLQVVSTAKTDTFSTTSTSFTDVTGLTVTITPKYSDSKILVLVDCKNSISTGVSSLRLMRDSTAIALGDAAGSRQRGSMVAAAPVNTAINDGSVIFLDSPATTSATTYKIQMRVESTRTGYVNRSSADTDADYVTRTASTITVMEIAQ